MIMKDIPEYEGLYAITDEGQVWSYRSQKFIKPFLSGPKKYFKVRLHNKGAQKTFYIHRLVALAFVPNPEGKSTVNHIDNDIYNNNWSNLEWVTTRENVVYSMEKGTRKIFSKIRCVETGEVYKNCADAARAMGVHRYTINCAVLGQVKTAAGYHWERVKKDENETSQSK